MRDLSAKSKYKNNNNKKKFEKKKTKTKKMVHLTTLVKQKDDLNFELEGYL